MFDLAAGKHFNSTMSRSVIYSPKTDIRQGDIIARYVVVASEANGRVTVLSVASQISCD